MNPSEVKRSPVFLVVVLVYAGLALTVFVYLVPPLFTVQQAKSLPLIGALQGDLPTYVLRFLLTAVLFGALPLVIGRIGGFRPAELGLAGCGTFLRSPIFLILLGGAIVVGVMSAYSAGLETYYPYSHTLLRMAAQVSGWYLVLHLLLYFLFYYVPWELFFRGFLVLPFLQLAEGFGDRSTGANTQAAFVIACFQIIPSSLIHFGHPFSETASAVLFGVLAAWLVVKTRSILPGLFIHAAVGLSLDTTILLRVVHLVPGSPLGGVQ